jgi:hydrogenase/urease accessory protein HupE
MKIDYTLFSTKDFFISAIASGFLYLLVMPLNPSLYWFLFSFLVNVFALYMGCKHGNELKALSKKNNEY